MENKNLEAKQLDELDAYSLYLEIGRELGGKQALPSDRDTLFALASAWMKKKRSQFQSAICNNQNIKDLFKKYEKQEQRVDLILAIGDLIAGITIGVSPLTVSALIVKEGYESLCC
ncbi:MAG: hypothetical protein V7L29_13955 [Nostoc sp.]|uniref:hypothetical protein n=1 Tax=Nostoc sp. TaxID=1180 RepID=UPI002FF8CDD7